MNPNRTIGWILVGAALGVVVTLGAYFAVLSLSDRDEESKTNSIFTRSVDSTAQDSRTPLANATKATESDNLHVDKPIEDMWNELIADEYPNVAQLGDLVRIAKDWMDEAGFGVIHRVNDSLTNPIVQNAVISAVLHHATQTDAESALQHALRLSGSRRDLALSAVVSAWVSFDPIQAMNTISAMRVGSLRRQLLEKLVRAWAEHDPLTVLKDIELVPENLRKLGEREALIALARTDPEGTTAFIGDISDTELKFTLTLELASNWFDQDPNAALDWALSGNTFVRNQVLTMILGKLAREDPRLALQTALSQPVDKSQIGLEVTVIAEVAATNLELAFKMLSQVRKGLTQKFSYLEVGKALVRNNETKRALSLALELPEGEHERGAYYNHIVHQWARYQPKSLVEHMEFLPTIDAQTQAATSLVYGNVGRNTLSETEMDYVRNFVPEDYHSETK